MNSITTSVNISQDLKIYDIYLQQHNWSLKCVFVGNSCNLKIKLETRKQYKTPFLSLRNKSFICLTFTQTLLIEPETAIPYILII